MKARVQCIDASILPAHTDPNPSEQIEVCTDCVAKVEAQLLARSVARTAWVEMLKAQVEDGRYVVDSQAIAKKMQFSPAMREILEYEINDVLPTVQEDDLQEK